MKTKDFGGPPYKKTKTKKKSFLFIISLGVYKKYKIKKNTERNKQNENQKRKRMPERSTHKSKVYFPKCSPKHIYIIQIMLTLEYKLYKIR